MRKVATPYEQRKSPHVAGSGLFALDMVIDPAGHLVSTALGGSAGNVLAILARLGWSSTPIANLGSDKAGERLFKEFDRLNADTRFFCRAKHIETPVVFQHMLDEGSRTTHQFSFTCPFCGRKRAPAATFQAEKWIEDVATTVAPNVFFFDRASETAVLLAEIFSGDGALVVFEPSLIGGDSDLFCRAVRAADIVKYADERLCDLDEFPVEEVAVEICTLGAEGLRFRAPSLGREWVHLDAYHVPRVVDTSGAGDWCTAGMLYHLFKQEPSFHISKLSYNLLHESLRFGQALSTLNCMTLGARGLAQTFTPSKITRTAQVLWQARSEYGPISIAPSAERSLSRFIERVLGNELVFPMHSRLCENEVFCCDAFFA